MVLLNLYFNGYLLFRKGLFELYLFPDPFL